ncbi:MAG TPA: PQQ-binding-like beta-propeller repeat protein [Vicinamibacterales bacterium]|jgi:outer membrane protein assembly factor BamB|nr:PQQ-binding-like beta-propeller repeat protein [Vicinamibacterales bacterium]|tara:strand:- start:203 stop:1588 length:1386 start_codon:yes stop_codon:yes gene_type:complete
MRLTSSITLGLLLWLTTPQATVAQQWPKFRGGNAGNVADDLTLPDTWGETENIAWKIDIPGLSWSSPIVWDDHVFVTTAISAADDEVQPIPGLYDPGEHNGSVPASGEHRWMVYDIDFDTGAVRWARELFRGVPTIARHLKNSFASETPVTDGTQLYVYFGAIGLIAALDFDGGELWRKEIGTFNTMQEMATASSPALHKDRLYVLNDNTTRSFLTALDTATGDEVWQVDRQEPGHTWATPLVWENRLRTEIVTSATGRVRSYGLDGSLLWELSGMSLLTIPSPFTSHGLVYISSGYPGGALRPVYAIQPGAAGDISVYEEVASGLQEGFPGTRRYSQDDHVVWSYPLLGTYNTTALVYGDIYYTLLDRGFLTAHDAATGEEVYGRQRLEIGNGFTASPWGYNGKIFLLSEDGDTFVVQAGPEFEILHKNSLNEMSLATPAVARGSLILRTQSKLYRIARR